jgi:SAM-dependent methyltransferase
MHQLKACPVCGSEDISLLYRGRTTRLSDKHRWTMFECCACTLGFLNPQPSWQDLQSYYSEDYEAYEDSHGATASDDELIRQARADGMFRHRPIPEDKKLLDVGPGGGFYLRICQKLGAIVKGVEPSLVAHERLTKAGFDVFHGMIEEYETEDRFDVITANQVLEHTPDPVSTLSKMRQLLAPDGVIWIAVPNAACLWHKRLQWKWDGADLPYHLVHFTPSSIARAGIESGLRVHSIKTYSSTDIVGFSMRKHLRENFGIPGVLSKFLFSEASAEKLGAELDARHEGDTIVVEFMAI